MMMARTLSECGSQCHYALGGSYISFGISGLCCSPNWLKHKVSRSAVTPLTLVSKRNLTCDFMSLELVQPISGSIERGTSGSYARIHLSFACAVLQRPMSSDRESTPLCSCFVLRVQLPFSEVRRAGARAQSGLDQISALMDDAGSNRVGWMTTVAKDLCSAIGSRRFSTVLADPPWRFQNATGKVAPEHKRLSRYGTMGIDDICALPVG